MGELRQSALPIPHAAKASVARLAAIDAKLGAYKRSHPLEIHHTAPVHRSP